MTVCRYMERLQQEDWDLLQSKKLTQRELMEEVSKCNEVNTCTCSVCCVDIIINIIV